MKIPYKTHFKKIFVILIFLLIQLPSNHNAESKSEGKLWFEKKRYAFLVGINTYKNTTELKYAVKDSREMYKLFSQVGHFNKIFILNDQDGKIIIENGKEISRDKKFLPTKRNIEETYKSILTETPDTVLFYYSGHGFIDGNDDKNSIAPMDVEVDFIKGKAVAKNGIVLTEMANGFKKESDKNLPDIEQVIFLIDACRSPLPKTETEEANSNKKELTLDAKAPNSNLPSQKDKPDSTKSETGKNNPKEEKPETMENITSFHNFGEEIPQIVQDAKGVVILIGTSPNEASLEDEDIQSGKFTYYIKKAISGGIQDETPAEYVTLESLELFVKKKFDQEQAEYDRILMEKGEKEFSQGKPQQAVYKVSTQRGFTGDFLITYGRPPETDVRVERRGYMDSTEERPVAAKILFNKDKTRYDLKFFAKSKDTGKYYPESLEGVSRMKYIFEKNQSDELIDFKAEQFNYKEEPVFTHGLELDEDNGWELTSVYKLTDEDKKDKDKKRIRFQRQKFDFNGNNILQEYFDDKGKPVSIGNAGITKTIRAWDYNGEKTLEEFYDAYGYLTNNEYGYARYTASYLGKGKPVSEEFFSSNGSLSGNQTGIARKTYTYDEGFKLIKKQFFDKDGKRIGDHEGIAITDYSYNNECVNRLWKIESQKEMYQISDEKSKAETKEKYKRKEMYSECIETEVYLDHLENPKARPNGIAKKESRFDYWTGLKTLEQFYRHDNRPWHLGGIFRTVYSYDDNSRLSSKKFFGEAMNASYEPVPVTDDKGIHEYRYQYGKTGGGKYQLGYKNELLERITYHSIDGSPVTTPEGISKEEHLFTFNRDTKSYEKAIIHFLDNDDNFIRADKNNLTLHIHDSNFEALLTESLDKDGKLKEDDFGTARYLRFITKLDKGEKVIVEPYKKDGKTNENIFGVVKAIYIYDEKGNQILKERFNAEGKLKGGDNYQIARYVDKYDEKGNPILSETFDENGALLGHENGIARFVWKYDEKGNMIEQDIYGADGKLISYYVDARTIWKYDDKGNKIQTERYRSTGELAWKITEEYNEKGNRTKIETRDSKGQLVANEERIVKILYSYDDTGNMISEEEYSTSDEVIKKTIWTYNQKGFKTLEEIYDFYNELTDRTIWKYDEMGNIILEEKYGNNGKLKDDEGIAKLEFLHDNKARETLDLEFNANWKLLHRKLLEALKEKDLKNNLNIEKQISYWAGKEKLEKKLSDSIGKENGKKLYNEFLDFEKKYMAELDKCTLRSVKYKADGTLVERKERFDRHRISIMEEPDESGVLNSLDYHLYFPNPRGQFEKRLIHLKLDRFYRPEEIEFEKR